MLKLYSIINNKRETYTIYIKNRGGDECERGNFD